MKTSYKILLFLLIIAGITAIPACFIVKAKNKKAAEAQLLKQEKERVELVLEAKREATLEESQRLFEGYYYDEAINKLKGDPITINKAISQKIDEYTVAKNNLVKYQGPIEHIFFHSLILYPEYLFPDLKKPNAGYNAGFAYKTELIKILPELLERDYVLYDITKLFKKNASGFMEMQDIYLPPNKKPLILSIDDPTYHYGVGYAKKLVLFDDKKLLTEVVTPEGNTIFTDDGDVELVLETFIENHPEFSYRGARGTIASTGYMGIFGYDLETTSSKEQAKQVVNELKRRGWTFASHSYTHNRDGFFGTNAQVSNIEYDTRKWKEEIDPIVGATNIFIAPYGFLLKGQALNVILDNGFDIYCTVAIYPEISIKERYALMSRNEIGGYALKMYKEQMNERFFNVDEVTDPYRPPLK